MEGVEKEKRKARKWETSTKSETKKKTKKVNTRATLRELKIHAVWSHQLLV